jgi:AraC-like DNA-binding protein
MLLNVSLLGFIFAGIILIFSSVRKSINVYLAAYFLFINLYSLVYFIIFENEDVNLAAFFSIHFTPFYFLTIPFLHLYIVSHQKDFRFKTRYLIYFVPFGVVLLNTLPYLFLPFSEKLVLAKEVLVNSEALYHVKLLFIPYYYQSLARPIFNLIFLFFTCYTYYQKRKELEFISLKFNGENFVFLLLLFAGFLNSLSFIFIINKMLITNFGFSLFGNVPFKTINNMVSYLAAGQNLILLFFPQKLFREQFIVDQPIRRKKDPNQDNSSLISQERLLEIDVMIQQFVTNQAYLIKGFSVTNITQETGIPVHQLSAYFNEYLKTNFNDWKNQLRIAYAVSEIESGKHKHITIEAIAIACGFTSRSNFNKAFIASMGQPPSQFIKGLKK